jgi:hypothetical protein
LIDFIKIILKDFERSKLECNPLLDFFDTINLTTGEMKTTNRNGNKVTPSKNASYNGLEFKIYDTGTISITGSLHKYWNAGAHNYNDFNIYGVLGVLSDLKSKFDIETRTMYFEVFRDRDKHNATNSDKSNFRQLFPA